MFNSVVSVVVVVLVHYTSSDTFFTAFSQFEGAK